MTKVKRRINNTGIILKHSFTPPKNTIGSAESKVWEYYILQRFPFTLASQEATLPLLANIVFLVYTYALHNDMHAYVLEPDPLEVTGLLNYVNYFTEFLYFPHIPGHTFNKLRQVAKSSDRYNVRT